MGYWTYYAAWVLLSYLVTQPKLLVGLVVLVFLHRVLPAPGPIFRAFARGRGLRRQLDLNPKNTLAARDLAWLELDLLRPKAALRWAELGLARSPDDAELQFLGGLALSRLGRHEEALTRLVAAVEREPRMRYGLPYLAAGESLLALGRWEEALDAFDRALRINSSDLRGYLGRARAHHARGERAECKKQIDEALSTYRCLPHHLRRQNRGARLTAFWLRIRLMREPLAVLQAALLVAGVLVLAALASGTGWFLWSVASYGDEHREFVLGDARCGEAQRQGDRSDAYLGCLARATVFPHSYDDPDDYESHVAQLRQLGLRVSAVSGKQVANEGTGAPEYLGNAIFLPGREEARYLVYTRTFGRYLTQQADFTAEALTPPLALVEAGEGTAIRDAHGELRRLPEADGEPCGDGPRAQASDAGHSGS